MKRKGPTSCGEKKDKKKRNLCESSSLYNSGILPDVLN